LIEVSDLAGNRLPLNLSRVFQHHVIAPPLEVEIQSAIPEDELPSNMVSMEHLDIARGDLVRLLSNDEHIHLHRILVNNPHDIPVTMELRLRANYRFTSDVEEVFHTEDTLSNFGFSGAECQALPNAPSGTLQRRPLDASQCSTRVVSGVPRTTCNVCHLDPLRHEMAPIDQLVEGYRYAILLAENREVDGNFDRFDGRRTVEIGPGAARNFDLGMSPGSPIAAPVHTSSAPAPVRSASALVTLDPAYRYLPPTQLLPARLESGVVYLAVAGFSMVPVNAEPFTVGSVLHDTVSRPVSAEPLPPITVFR
jgi:hypothetical protein